MRRTGLAWLLRALCATVLPLALLSAPEGRELRGCGSAEIAIPQCCCAAHAATPAPATELSSRCCCSFERPHGTAHAAGTAAARTGGVPTLALAAASRDVDFTGPALAHRSAAATYVPHRGPPLFLMKRVFLI